SRGRTFSPEAALSISMPRWCLGWDVLCWLGHRRFARHWSVPQLRLELKDTHWIRLSDDAIENDIGRYQTMLAARQQDPEQLAEVYRDIASFVLTIDGLQPEKGHETLYVVRELMRKRVWFAEPLLSSATEEVRGLRAIERRVLEDRRHAAAPAPLPLDESPKTEETPLTDPSEAPAPCLSGNLGLITIGEAPVEDEAGEVVLGYCAAVRGILND